MMVLLYFRRIVAGKNTFNDVASPWVDEVKQMLIDEGYEDLIDAE